MTHFIVDGDVLMNNKDVMVDSIRKAWELYDKDMCATTFSIAATAGVSLVLSYLTKEQTAHDETKGLLKERMAHQESLGLRLGNAERSRLEAEYACAGAKAQVSRLQSEIDARQTYIEELELRLSILSGVEKCQKQSFAIE